MNKEEILEKSRAENRNRDIYEQEILKQASAGCVIVMLVLSITLHNIPEGLAVGVAFGTLRGGTNWGVWALVFSTHMTTFWVKYWRLRHGHELVMALIYTALVALFSGGHIYHLIASSTIL